MGQPGPGNSGSSCTEYIGAGSERGEVKHLSTPRKRNQIEIPSVVASERGRAQTAGSNSIGVVGAVLGRSPESYQISSYLKALGKDNQRG